MPIDGRTVAARAIKPPAARPSCLSLWRHARPSAYISFDFPYYVLILQWTQDWFARIAFVRFHSGLG